MSVLLMSINFAAAFMDVVVDSMMVIQAKRDPENGSESLQSYSWIVKGVGGILGCSLASYMTQNYHPKWCLLIYSILGIFVSLSGFFLNQNIDQEGA